MVYLTLDIGGSGIKLVEYNEDKEIINFQKFEFLNQTGNRYFEFQELEKKVFLHIYSKYSVKSYPQIFVSNCGTFNQITYEVERWNNKYSLLKDLKAIGYECCVLNDGLAHPQSLINSYFIEGPVLSITFGTGIGYAAFDKNLSVFTPCETDDIIRDHRVDDNMPDKDPHELLGYEEMIRLWRRKKFDVWCRRFLRLMNSLFANIQPKTLMLFGGITQEDYEEGYKILNTKIIPLINQTYYFEKKGLKIMVGGKYSANEGVLNYFGDKN